MFGGRRVVGWGGLFYLTPPHSPFWERIISPLVANNSPYLLSSIYFTPPPSNLPPLQLPPLTPLHLIYQTTTSPKHILFNSLAYTTMHLKHRLHNSPKITPSHKYRLYNFFDYLTPSYLTLNSSPTHP